jgi:hypothetical protein
MHTPSRERGCELWRQHQLQQQLRHDGSISSRYGVSTSNSSSGSSSFDGSNISNGYRNDSGTSSSFDGSGTTSSSSSSFDGSNTSNGNDSSSYSDGNVFSIIKF